MEEQTGVTSEDAHGSDEKAESAEGVAAEAEGSVEIVDASSVGSSSVQILDDSQPKQTVVEVSIGTESSDSCKRDADDWNLRLSASLSYSQPGSYSCFRAISVLAVFFIAVGVAF